MSEDPRLRAARSMLHDAGFPAARVAVAGHDRGVVVISQLDLASLPAIAALAPGIKALGFSYLTLDITEPAQ